MKHPITDTTRNIIDQLVAHGLPNGKPCLIEFAFYGEPQNLVNIRRYLLSIGYSEDTSQTDDMLVMTHQVPLDYESIGKALSDMQDAATKYNVTFDGWSASIKQQR